MGDWIIINYRRQITPACIQNMCFDSLMNFPTVSWISESAPQISSFFRLDRKHNLVLSNRTCYSQWSKNVPTKQVIIFKTQTSEEFQISPYTRKMENRLQLQVPPPPPPVSIWHLHDRKVFLQDSSIVLGIPFTTVSSSSPPTPLTQLNRWLYNAKFSIIN